MPIKSYGVLRGKAIEGKLAGQGNSKPHYQIPHQGGGSGPPNRWGSGPDYPVLQDFTAALRPYAADAAAMTTSSASGSTRWWCPSTSSRVPAPAVRRVGAGR